MVNEVRLVVSVLCFVSSFGVLNHSENGKMDGVATFLTLMTLEFVGAHVCPTTFYTLITAALVFTYAGPPWLKSRHKRVELAVAHTVVKQVYVSRIRTRIGAQV